MFDFFSMLLKGNYSSLGDILDKEKSILESEKQLSDLEKANELIKLGYLELFKGNLSEANKIYEQAVSLFSGSSLSEELFSKFNIELAFLGLNLGLFNDDYDVFNHRIEELLALISINNNEMLITEVDRKKILGNLLRLKGYYFIHKGDFVSSNNNFLEAKGFFEEINDSLGLGMVTYDLGYLSLYLFEIEKARAFFNQSLTYFTESSFLLGKYLSLNGLGISMLYLGKLDLAKDFLNKAFVGIKGKGFLFYEALIENSLGSLELMLGNIDSAKKLFSSSLEKLSSLKLMGSVSLLKIVFPFNFLVSLFFIDDVGFLNSKFNALFYPLILDNGVDVSVFTYYLMGLISLLENNVFDAEICFEEALFKFIKSSSLPSLFKSVLSNNLGAIFLYNHKYVLAREKLLDALAYYQSSNFKEGLLSVYLNLAVLEFTSGEKEKSVEYYVRCLAYADDLGLKQIKPTILLFLGEVYESLKNNDWAKTCYQQGLTLIERDSLSLPYERLTLKAKLNELEKSEDNNVMDDLRIKENEEN